MSEESKTAEGDYVIMGTGHPTLSGAAVDMHLDDPNLTQEEKDHRLAVAMQQQENAAAYSDHKKKHDQNQMAQRNRTARSGTYTKLAAVRAKDHGMLTVPSDYTSDHAYSKSDGDYMAPTGLAPPPPNASPQEIADYKLAVELQKVEQVDAGTVRTMQKMVHEEEETEEAQKLRTGRSKCTL